jgi:hypothetical protein
MGAGPSLENITAKEFVHLKKTKIFALLHKDNYKDNILSCYDSVALSKLSTTKNNNFTDFRPITKFATRNTISNNNILTLESIIAEASLQDTKIIDIGKTHTNNKHYMTRNITFKAPFYDMFNINTINKFNIKINENYLHSSVRNNSISGIKIAQDHKINLNKIFLNKIFYTQEYYNFDYYNLDTTTLKYLIDQECNINVNFQAGLVLSDNLELVQVLIDNNLYCLPKKNIEHAILTDRMKDLIKKIDI